MSPISNESSRVQSDDAFRMDDSSDVLAVPPKENKKTLDIQGLR